MRGEVEIEMENRANQPEITCGAKTRKDGACTNKPEPGKRRCRLHGGAAGSGAKPGNHNALKHGQFSKAAINRRREAKSLLIESLDLLNSLTNQKG
jgi:uncharacterized protein YjcR